MEALRPEAGPVKFHCVRCEVGGRTEERATHVALMRNDGLVCKDGEGRGGGVEGAVWTTTQGSVAAGPAKMERWRRAGGVWRLLESICRILSGWDGHFSYQQRKIPTGTRTPRKRGRKWELRDVNQSKMCPTRINLNFGHQLTLLSILTTGCPFLSHVLDLCFTLKFR